MTVRVTVDTGRLNRILRNLGGNTRDAVRKVAFRVEAEAKTNAQEQHVWDTGALVNSIYTEIGDPERYTEADAKVKAQARDGEPPAETTPLPTPSNRTTAHVGPSVHYAIYHEFGTHKMAARPYLAPAVETVAGELERNPDVFRGVVTDDSR